MGSRIMVVEIEEDVKTKVDFTTLSLADFTEANGCLYTPAKVRVVKEIQEPDLGFVWFKNSCKTGRLEVWKENPKP